MHVNPTAVTELHQGPLAEQLGIRFVEASRDRVVAELAFRDTLTTAAAACMAGR